PRVPGRRPSAGPSTAPPPQLHHYRTRSTHAGPTTPPSTHLEPAPAHPAAHHPSSRTRARTRNPQQTQAKSQARTAPQGQPPPAPPRSASPLARHAPGTSPAARTRSPGPYNQPPPWAYSAYPPDVDT